MSGAASGAAEIGIDGAARAAGTHTALTCVVALGRGLWDRVFGAPRPAGLHEFPGFAGARPVEEGAPRVRGIGGGEGRAGGDERPPENE